MAPHDAARRDATALFGVAIGVLAVYCLGVFGLVVLVADASVAGTVDRLGSLDPETVAAVGAVGLACVAVVAISAIAAWRGARGRRARDVGTRRPTATEAARVRVLLADACEPYGVHVPRIAMHDDAAPNAASWIGPAGPTVCFTTGATRLADDELRALCHQLVTGLGSPARNRGVDAVDLVLVAERWTQFVWAGGIVAFLLAAVSTNRSVAGAVLGGVILLVVVTRPAIFMAKRSLPGLFKRIDQLIDLETARRSSEPEPLARLLLRLLEDPGRVRTSWRVVHLWFERDAIEPAPSVRGGSRSRVHLLLGSPETGTSLQAVWARTGPATLGDRARVAVNLASGDRKLRARLERATATAD